MQASWPQKLRRGGLRKGPLQNLPLANKKRGLRLLVLDTTHVLLRCAMLRCAVLSFVCYLMLCYDVPQSIFWQKGVTFCHLLHRKTQLSLFVVLHSTHVHANGTSDLPLHLDSCPAYHDSSSIERSMCAERAEEEVKAAADAINKQLPKEAQGGSLQPLVEEKEEVEAQPLDTFSSEIDSFDTVTTCSDNTLLPFDLSFACCLLLSVFCLLPLTFCLSPHAFAPLHLPDSCKCWPCKASSAQGVIGHLCPMQGMVHSTGNPILC